MHRRGSPGRSCRPADTLLYKAKLEGRNRIEAKFVTGRLGDGAGNNPVHLEWKDSYCSGNTLIDSQHRNLFYLSNALLNALQSSRPNDEVFRIIEQLLTDVARHFQDEEAILQALDFPGLKAHAEKHAMLYKRGSEMARTLHSKTPVLGEIFTFLAYEVIVQHLHLTDREYFPFLGNGPDHKQ